MRYSFVAALLVATVLAWESPALRAMEIAVATQLALKEDFERSDSIGPWHQELPKGAPSNILEIDNTPLHCHSGSGALKFEITNQSDNERFVHRGTKVPESAGGKGRQLRLRVFARTASAAGQQPQIVLRVLQRDQTAVIGWLEGKTDLVPVSPSSEWRAYTVTGQLAPGTRSVMVYAVIKKPTPGQTLWLDDLSLEVVSTTPQ